MARVFTSDLHFFHKRIVEISNRGVCTTQDDHDAWLLDLINSACGPKDCLVSLGDFSFASMVDTTLGVFNKLRCKNLVLVTGNHDTFQSPVSRMWYKEISIQGHRTILSHFAFESWHQQHRGSLHLHGHSHGFLPPRGKRLDVGLDSAYNLFGKHKLFTEEDILQILGASPLVVADSHRSPQEI